jgi:predicted ABC-class ATPase
MLSDPALARAEALGLPTFVADGENFSQRLTIIANRPTIEKVPVDDPQNHAAEIVAWLRSTP